MHTLDERKDRAIAPTIQAFEAAKQAFIEGVERGVDRPLPLGVSIARQWPVSTFLGECGREAQALLFQACTAALASRGPDTVALLRAFVGKVASDYATDAETLWECD